MWVERVTTGVAKREQDIVASVRGRHAFEAAVALRGECAEVGEEIVRDRSFPAGGRVKIDKCAR